MGPEIPGFANAQSRYDMHYDQPEETDDSDTEDDVTMLDIQEEEKEEEDFWRRHG